MSVQVEWCCVDASDRVVIAWGTADDARCRAVLDAPQLEGAPLRDLHSALVAVAIAQGRKVKLEREPARSGLFVFKAPQPDLGALFEEFAPGIYRARRPLLPAERASIAARKAFRGSLPEPGEVAQGWKARPWLSFNEAPEGSGKYEPDAGGSGAILATDLPERLRAQIVTMRLGVDLGAGAGFDLATTEIVRSEAPDAPLDPAPAPAGLPQVGGWWVFAERGPLCLPAESTLELAEQRLSSFGAVELCVGWTGPRGSEWCSVEGAHRPLVDPSTAERAWAIAQAPARADGGGLDGRDARIARANAAFRDVDLLALAEMASIYRGLIDAGEWLSPVEQAAARRSVAWVSDEVGAVLGGPRKLG